MGSSSRAAFAIAVVGFASCAGFGCGGKERLSLSTFVTRTNAVCARERQASRHGMGVETFLRSRRRLRSAYGRLRPPPERFDTAFSRFLRAFDGETRAQLVVRKNRRALATLRESRTTADFHRMEKILSRDDRIASVLVAENLADAKLEVARLRLPLQCGEKVRRSIREARVHNLVAPMCLYYHRDTLAEALGVEATEREIAHALRQLSGLSRVEPACLEGFAFQRRG